MTELNAEHARRAIVEHTRRLAESAAAAGPDAAVPTIPGQRTTGISASPRMTEPTLRVGEPALVSARPLIPTGAAAPRIEGHPAPRRWRRASRRPRLATV